MTDGFPSFSDAESAEQWIKETLDKEILRLLSEPSRPYKPIDPTAPLPHWAKRTLQKAWLKKERERRATKTP